jgi:hypothetical protein
MESNDEFYNFDVNFFEFDDDVYKDLQIPVSWPPNSIPTSANTVARSETVSVRQSTAFQNTMPTSTSAYSNTTSINTFTRSGTDAMRQSTVVPTTMPNSTSQLCIAKASVDNSKAKPIETTNTNEVSKTTPFASSTPVYGVSSTGVSSLDDIDFAFEFDDGIEMIMNNVMESEADAAINSTTTTTHGSQYKSNKESVDFSHREKETNTNSTVPTCTHASLQIAQQDNKSRATDIQITTSPRRLLSDDSAKKSFPPRSFKRQRQCNESQRRQHQPEVNTSVQNTRGCRSDGKQPLVNNENSKGSVTTGDSVTGKATGTRMFAGSYVVRDSNIADTKQNISNRIANASCSYTDIKATVSLKRRIPGPAGKLLSSHLTTGTESSHTQGPIIYNSKTLLQGSLATTAGQTSPSTVYAKSLSQGIDVDLECGSWQTMLQTLVSFCPGPTTHLFPQYRTQWLLANHPFFQHNISFVLKKGFCNKVPFLVVSVSSFDPCNIDVSATFKDASGNDHNQYRTLTPFHTSCFVIF